MSELETRIREIKQNISIIDVIGRELGVSVKYGSQKCPFHNDSNPSFSIANSSDGDIASCFSGSCGFGTGKDVINVIQYIYNYSPGEAIRYLEKNYLNKVPVNNYKRKEVKNMISAATKESLKKIIELSNKYLLNNMELLEELSGKGVSKDFISRSDIGFFDKSIINFLDDDVINNSKLFSDIKTRKTPFVNRYLFPYYKNGEIVGLLARKRLNNNSNRFPKYLKIKGMMDWFFGTELLDKSDDTIYLVEGVFDQISLLSHEVNALAINGTSITPEKVSYLKSLNKKVIVALDNDTAGKNAIDRVVKQLRMAGVKIEGILSYGDLEEKDPNDIITKYGIERFITLPVDHQNAPNFDENDQTDINISNEDYSFNGGEILKNFQNNLDDVFLYRTKNGYFRVVIDRKGNSKITQLTDFVIDFTTLYLDNEKYFVKADINIITANRRKRITLDLTKIYNYNTLMSRLAATGATSFKITEDVFTCFNAEFNRAMESDNVIKVIEYDTLGFDTNRKMVFFRNAIIDIKNKQIYFSNQEGDIDIDGVLYRYTKHANCSEENEVKLLNKQELDSFLEDYYELFGDTGLITLSWVLGSLEKEYFVRKSNQYHLLSITAERGTGKTSLLKMAADMIGDTIFDLSSSTKAGIRRHLARYANFPMFFDEYNTLSEYKDSVLKAAFNNSARQTMANRDSDTDSIDFSVKSSIMVVGEAVSGTKSLVDRCLTLTISKVKNYVLKEGVFKSKYDESFIESVVPSLFFYKIKEYGIGIDSDLYVNIINRAMKIADNFELTSRELNMIVSALYSYEIYLSKMVSFCNTKKNSVYETILERFREKKVLDSEDHSLTAIFEYIISEAELKRIDVRSKIFEAGDGDILISLYHILNQVNLKRLFPDFGTTMSVVRYIINEYGIRTSRRYIDGLKKSGYILDAKIINEERYPKNEFEYFLYRLYQLATNSDNNKTNIVNFNNNKVGFFRDEVAHDENTQVANKQMNELYQLDLSEGEDMVNVKDVVNVVDEVKGIKIVNNDSSDTKRIIIDSDYIAMTLDEIDESLGECPF